MKKLLTLVLSVAMICSAFMSGAAWAEEAGEPDFENWTVIEDTEILDIPVIFETLPDGYNTYDTEHKGQILRLHYTTDAYGDGVEYEKYCTVYLPYGYDAEDTATKYNVLYFQHGNSGSPNELWDHDLKTHHALKLFDNMFDPDHQIMEPCIIICPTYYFETPEDKYVTPADNQAGDGRYSDMPANYYDEIVEDLIPQIESQFNVYCEDFSKEGIKASRDHRAWAGYSRGSICTWEVMHADFEYFKYWMPCSGEVRSLVKNSDSVSGNASVSGDAAAINVPLTKTTPDAPELAFAYINSAIEANPDLDFFLIGYIGGETDQRTITGYIDQMQYFYEQKDTFSYGTDPEVNNFYFVKSELAHNDLYFPLILANARDILFK